MCKYKENHEIQARESHIAKSTHNEVVYDALAVCVGGGIYIQVCMYVCICIYIYIYGNPPMNYRPSFCIVNTVSKQLFRQVRILYLSKTTENKLRFQENVSVNSFTFDVRSGSCISQGLLKSISHFSTGHDSQLIEVRREHEVNGSTVPSQSKTNFA